MKRYVAISTLVCVLGLVALSASRGAAAGPRSVAGESALAASGARTIDTITVDVVAELLRDAGYRAEVKETKTGRPMISSSSGGVKFQILLYDPTGVGDQYEDFQFIAWFNDTFEGTLNDANAWNMKKRHLHAMYDKSDNSVGVAMDVTVVGGVTEQHIKENFELWDAMLSEFVKFLGDAH